MYPGSDLGAGVSLLPPSVTNPSVRYVLGHRQKKSMSQKDPRGRVKVYRDKHRCWADAKAEFGKKITNYDVFGMNQENWEEFQKNTPFVEVDGEQAVHPDQGVDG